MRAYTQYVRIVLFIYTKLENYLQNLLFFVSAAAHPIKIYVIYCDLLRSYVVKKMQQKKIGVCVCVTVMETESMLLLLFFHSFIAIDVPNEISG